MIDRDNHYKTFDVSCDYCTVQKSFDTSEDWKALINKMKSEGWKIFKEDDEWSHKCPACVADRGLGGNAK